MSPTRVLLVDDDELVRAALTELLEQSGFKVTSVTNVVEALKHISSESYDVLLSDLQMPGAGDGLTVVSAMRHANPLAVTLLLSSFPQMEAAAQAILLQADEILFKPMDLTLLLDVIKQRVAIGPVRNREVETVAAILDRTSYAAIQEWYKLVQTDELVMSVSMSRDATEQFGQYRFQSVVGWSHDHRRRNRFAAESGNEKLLRSFVRGICC